MSNQPKTPPRKPNPFKPYKMPLGLLQAALKAADHPKPVSMSTRVTQFNKDL